MDMYAISILAKLTYFFFIDKVFMFINEPIDNKIVNNYLYILITVFNLIKYNLKI